MSRETYAERQEREAKRDRILGFSWEVAKHTAGGEMVYVERAESVSDWPRFQFSGVIGDHRCECGMQMVPFPTFTKRFGVMPTWTCVVCNLPWVVETCEKIQREAASK